MLIYISLQTIMFCAELLLSSIVFESSIGQMAQDLKWCYIVSVCVHATGISIRHQLLHQEKL